MTETMQKSSTMLVTADVNELRIDKFPGHVSIFGKIDRELYDHQGQGSSTECETWRLQKSLSSLSNCLAMPIHWKISMGCI